jgi:LPXTG-motif cell wall-anchored protein
VPFTTKYVSTCTGITATIINGSAAGDYALLWARSGIDGIGGVPDARVQLEPGERHTVFVKAPNGRGFSVSWQVTAVHDIDDTFVTWRKPADCRDGELPVTGSNVTWIMALSGLLLVTLGALTIGFMRRRRHSTA